MHGFCSDSAGLDFGAVSMAGVAPEASGGEPVVGDGAIQALAGLPPCLNATGLKATIKVCSVAVPGCSALCILIDVVELVFFNCRN